MVGQGGDGGTVDIGFGCLSGMFERNDDVLYVCYDNEALHEHRRAALRRDAAGRAHRHHAGRRRRARATSFGQGKNAPLIAMAHEIPYVATATVADLRDLEAKVERAMELRGARYLHVLVPCPLGWGSGLARHDPDRAAGQGDRAVPGLRGRATARSPRSRRSAGRCRSRSTCARSGATRHLFGDPSRATDVIARIQARADRNIERFGLLDGGDA